MAKHENVGNTESDDEWCIVSRSGSMRTEPSLSNSEVVVREGYLLKKGENIKNWRRRYFILFANGALLGYEVKPVKRNYYSDHIGPSGNRGDDIAGSPDNKFGYSTRVNNNFCVSHCQIIKLDEPKPFVFIVQLRSGVDCNRIAERRFCALSNDDREKWCSAFESIREKKTGEKSLLSPSDLRNFVNMSKLNLHNDNISISLSDFHIIRQLGKGTYGKVALVKRKDDEKGKYYAMKIISKRLIIEKDEVEHTLSERRLLHQCSHPFLTTLEYAFQTTTHLYMVMDYAIGGEIYFHLQRERRFPESKARFYCSEIVLALEYLHSKNIIHRDLKLENLLLDAEGHIKISDFGLCKQIKNDVSTTSTFCGTAEYLAPEVIDDELYLSGYGKEVDWWALGVVLYEMICGCPPFTPDDQLFQRILCYNVDFRYLPQNSCNSTKSLINALLQKCPEDRIGHNGVEEVKVHPFFLDVETDWEGLIQKTVPVPFKPDVRNEEDLRYFDEEFTKQEVTLTPDSNFGATELYQNQNLRHFSHFSYNG